METSLEVGVSPATAFEVFTGEIDRWWGNGPIDSWDFSRAESRRIEPGVGGRVLEVYDGDLMELARITVWEPGKRVAWRSSLDEVTIEVRFQATDAGTLVTVEGEVPEGGNEAAGLAVLRVTPEWLPRYLDRGRLPWPAIGRLAVVVHYERPASAARFLCASFGFQTTREMAEGESAPDPWIELRLGSSVVVVRGAGGAAAAAPTHEVVVFVDDVRAHFESASRAGASIVEPVARHGFTGYVADDTEGRRWRFVQASPRQPAACLEKPLPAL